MKLAINLILILLTLTTIIYAKELGYIEARDENGFKIDNNTQEEISIGKEIFGAEIINTLIDEENKMVIYYFRDETEKSFKLKD